VSLRALVLARGRGQRMQAAQPGAALTAEQEAAAARGWKALMPVGGRPFLDYVLSSLADAGCREVGVVIGREQRDDFRAYLTGGRVQRTRLTLIDQPRARGTADAVRSAARWLEDAPFLVVNGDNLYPADALGALAALDGPGAALFERDVLISAGNMPSERVAAFAIAQVNPAGDVVRLVEKPAAADLESTHGPVLVSMNAWRFDHRILTACSDVGRSPRGEYELPAAVELAIARGVRVRSIVAHGPVLDLSGRADVAEVSRRLSNSGPRP
jgi:glucose-1-phosphate thymidylyltransferase